LSRVSNTVREQIRLRAGERCEYCHLPEQVSIYGHHVDHIVASKHGGSSQLENLAWACFQCNVNKGTDIASLDLETGELTRFYDPRTAAGDEHFRLEGARVVGTTPQGRVTVHIFQINHPDQVESRRNLMDGGNW
jgi:hypothetical protein